MTGCIPTKGTYLPGTIGLDWEQDNLWLQLRNLILEGAYGYDVVGYARATLRNLGAVRVLAAVFSYPFSYVVFDIAWVDDCGVTHYDRRLRIWMVEGMDVQFRWGGLDDEPDVDKPDRPPGDNGTSGRPVCVETVVTMDWYGDSYLDDEPGRYTRTPDSNSYFTQHSDWPTKQEVNRKYGIDWIRTEYRNCSDVYYHVTIGYRYHTRVARQCDAQVWHYC